MIYIIKVDERSVYESRILGLAKKVLSWVEKQNPQSLVVFMELEEN
jgi:hypothetical protein